MLLVRVADAYEQGERLAIEGAGSKAFYGRTAQGEPLEAARHAGIVSYEPSELVITARAGTTLDALEETLGGAGQMLAFEPPRHGEGATLGGTIACGLSGPRRPYAGAARDFVLGVRVINGRGEDLRFGGQVMKNVAGYDVARLTTGALGTLGVILEVSLKVLPRPAAEETRRLELDEADALSAMNRWAGRPLPISATAWHGGALTVRLSGSATGVRAAGAEIGGEALADGDRFWRDLREHRLTAFDGAAPLWRLSLPALTPALPLGGSILIEWSGSQRWLRSPEPAARLRAAIEAVGGHATQFRDGPRDGEIFHPLGPALAGVHARLKAAFDPKGILNPGRMYRDW